MLICLAALVMYSCKADVDIAKIDDPTVKLGFGAALPVGEVTATLGDFLPDDLTEMDVVSIREDGVMCFHMTDSMGVSLDDIDLMEYMNQSASASCILGDQPVIQEAMTAIPGGFFVLTGKPDGTPYEISFDIGLSLKDLQSNTDQRFDSALITKAVFMSKITQQDLAGLTFDKIESIDLILPAEMHRAAGQVISANLDGKDYGDDIPLVIDNFTLDLVKDHNAPLGGTNMVDSVTMTIKIKIFLEYLTDVVTIKPTSGFEYSFSITQFDYTALFGYFNPSALSTSQKLEMDFSEMLPIWSSIGNFCLPFSDPRMDFKMKLWGIGAPIAVSIDHLTAEDRNTHEKKSASFDGKPSKDYVLENVIRPTDALDKVVENSFSLSKDVSEGQIDQLFTIQPEKLEAEYKVKILDDPEFPQLRLTKSAGVDIKMDIDLPFMFNEGLDLSLTDTLQNVNISEFSLDSLLANVEVIDSVDVKMLKLVLVVKNTLPFSMILSLNPVDGDGNSVDLGIPDLKNLVIPAPSDYDSETKTFAEPGVKEVVVGITNETMKKLPKIANILFTVGLKDPGTNPAELYPVRFEKSSQLMFKIAVAANVDAYLRVAF